MRIRSTFFTCFFLIIQISAYSQKSSEYYKENANYFSRYYKGTLAGIEFAPDELYPMKNTIYIFENNDIWILRQVKTSNPDVTKIRMEPSKGMITQQHSKIMEGTVFEGREKGQTVLIMSINDFPMIHIIYDATLDSSKKDLEQKAIREVFSQ